MPDIQGILFDKDGTLIDLEQSWLAVYRAAAQDLAGQIHQDQPSIEQLTATILERSGWPQGADRPDPESPLTWALTIDIAEFWAAMPEFNHLPDLQQWLLNIFANTDRFPPVAVTDLPALMAELAQFNLAFGVATMDQEAKARHVLDRFGITDHFGYVAGADSGFGVKPDAGMVLGFCEHTGLAPANVMVVGDTHADMGMARSAKAGLVIGVLTGGGQAGQLQDLADQVVPSIADLPAVLRGIRR